MEDSLIKVALSLNEIKEIEACLKDELVNILQKILNFQRSQSYWNSDVDRMQNILQDLKIYVLPSNYKGHPYTDFRGDIYLSKGYCPKKLEWPQKRCAKLLYLIVCLLYELRCRSQIIQEEAWDDENFVQFWKERFSYEERILFLYKGVELYLSFGHISKSIEDYDDYNRLLKLIRENPVKILGKITKDYAIYDYDHIWADERSRD